MTPNSTLSVSNKQPLLSSSNLETAWLGFRLDNLFYPLVAFGVQRTQNINVSGTINFDRVLANEGNGYNSSTGFFIVPVSGIYFLSIVTPSLFGLYVNPAYTEMFICLCDSVHITTDQVSTRGSLMLTLNVNDKVQVIPNAANLPINVIRDGIASFQGFLYSPRSGNKTAWSVSRTVSSGPTDYLSFNLVNVNTANCWNAAFKNVTIPTSGMYYVDITDYPCGTAFGYCSGNGDNVIQVLHNGNPIVRIRLSIATFNNCASRSRSALVSLKAGDELRVNIPTGGCHYSNSGRMMAFSGFLLY